MDHKSIAAKFKGLSPIRSPRCLDEFNIIATQVPSVVSNQVKWALDTLRENSKEFKIGDDLIKLERNCGILSQ
jgi:hypothetical protein